MFTSSESSSPALRERTIILLFSLLWSFWLLLDIRQHRKRIVLEQSPWLYSISKGQRVSLTTSEEQPIEIRIPRDPSFGSPSMFLHNVTNLRSFNYHQTQLKEMSSIHIEFHPLNINLSYLFVYHFDSFRRQQIDGWTIFSPNNTSEDHLYRYFLDNEQTAHHQSLIFGFRELNSTEIARFSSIEDLLTLTEPGVFHFGLRTTSVHIVVSLLRRR